MRFETLSKKHVGQLFNFELENRQWFESLIAPRDNNFYSKEGLHNHVQEQLDNMKLSISYCGVLVKDKEIVARGNLTDISEKKANVGYRVSENFTSRGYASLCVSKLVNKATELNIKTLQANVLDNNPISKHILEKHGFDVIKRIPDFFNLNGQKLGCSLLQKIG